MALTRHQASMAAIEQMKAEGAIDAAKADGLLDKKKSYGVTKKAEIQQQLLSGNAGVARLLGDAAQRPGLGTVPRKGEELKALQGVMNMYRSWAHGVAPGKHSEEFIMELRDLNSSRLFFAVEAHVAEQKAKELQPQPQHPAAPNLDPFAAAAMQPPPPPPPQQQPQPQAPQPPAVDYSDLVMDEPQDDFNDDVDFDMIDPDGF
eukprot:TRINITY_DN331_c0_g6_i1.p1 TRINITY_DN331_c0_g6~~TRINITY_DN331_c0_g6_i1.p1  ORF type:complete len:230 (+),score=116.05 TRINITY_DN331_c0_g6_i1:81-692(+)